MKKVIKLFMAFVITVMTMTVIPSYISGAKSDWTVTSDIAKEIAEGFIISDREINNPSFKADIKIKNIVELTGTNNEISAFLIELIDSEEKDSGYVIVGANDNNPVIIEYAYDGKCFLRKAIEMIDNDDSVILNDIIYCGGLDYIIKGCNCIGETVFYVCDAALGRLRDYSIYDIFNLIGDFSVYDVYNSIGGFKNEWDFIRETINNSGDRSVPPIGEVIIAPEDFESYYKSVSSKSLIEGEPLLDSFFVTSDFHGTNNCGPTCGVNFLYYWYCKGKNRLLSSDWQSVYDTLYADMNTEKNNTTKSQDFCYAITNYLYNHNVSYSSARYYSSKASWSRIYDEISRGYPAVLLLQGHELYGDHYVLALGYNEYTYSGTKGISRYILIADGWDASPTRYVHYSVGYKNGGGMGVFKIRVR